MADVAITLADVRPLPGAIVRRYPAAASGNVGDAIYLASGGVTPADADVDASSRVRGIVVAVAGGSKTTYASGDNVDVVTDGPVTGYASMTRGATLYASVTTGRIADARPAGASGDFVHVVGFAENANTIYVQPFTDLITAA